MSEPGTVSGGHGDQADPVYVFSCGFRIRKVWWMTDEMFALPDAHKLGVIRAFADKERAVRGIAPRLRMPDYAPAHRGYDGDSNAEINLHCMVYMLDAFVGLSAAEVNAAYDHVMRISAEACLCA